MATGNNPEQLAHRGGLKAGLLMAWEARPTDNLSCEVDGDERTVSDWLRAVDLGEFDDVADEKGVGYA